MNTLFAFHCNITLLKIWKPPTLNQIWKSLYMFVFIQKQYRENFTFLILRNLELFAREVCKFFKSRLILNIFCFWMFVNKLSHIARVYISERKRCFNVKSSTY